MAKKQGWGDKHDWDTMKQEYIKGDVPSVSEFIRHKLGWNWAMSWNSIRKTTWRKQERLEYWERAYKLPKITTEQQRRFCMAFEKITTILDTYAEAMVENLRHRMKSWTDENGKYHPPHVSIKEMQELFDFISPYMSWNRWSTADEDQAKFDMVEKLKFCYEQQMKGRANLADRQNMLKGKNHHNF